MHDDDDAREIFIRADVLFDRNNNKSSSALGGAGGKKAPSPNENFLPVPV
jgi:hypothetical protein